MGEMMEKRQGSLSNRLIRYFGFMIGAMVVIAIFTYFQRGPEIGFHTVFPLSFMMIACASIMGMKTLNWLRSYLVDPLEQLSVCLTKIVEGDLRVQLPELKEYDELSVLVTNFGKLLSTLKDDRQKISAAVKILAISIEQIMKSTSSSANGASQTAATVTETTVAAEEVRQTTMVATENSRFVADLAEETAKVSLEGRSATESTVGQMTRMREQMRTIAEGMAGLLEKSQAIVEITSTVDDLAQQSNLLAVNAAVEAARAGELGKGFSVVAQEVKALAALSKEATAEVRRILDDIQKATASAALSIEQGSGMVEAAVKQSSEAGNAIEALTKSVSEAASAASQIAAANQEQLIGIDQVVTAMQGIQGAMKKHAEESRNIDGAARDLYAARNDLQLLIDRYVAE